MELANTITQAYEGGGGNQMALEKTAVCLFVVDSILKCDPPRENRDKGDSTLTTRFHFKTKELGFSTLNVCSGAHFVIKLFCFVGHTKNNTACSH